MNQTLNQPEIVMGPFKVYQSTHGVTYMSGALWFAIVVSVFVVIAAWRSGS